MNNLLIYQNIIFFIVYDHTDLPPKKWRINLSDFPMLLVKFLISVHSDLSILCSCQGQGVLKHRGSSTEP